MIIAFCNDGLLNVFTWMFVYVTIKKKITAPCVLSNGGVTNTV